MHDKGPLLIVAGAGTGRQAVITQRIVNLIEKKLAKPEEIWRLPLLRRRLLKWKKGGQAFGFWLSGFVDIYLPRLLRKSFTGKCFRHWLADRF